MEIQLLLRLCDLLLDSVDVVDPMFVSFGGRPSYGGIVTTIKCFEDKGLNIKSLGHPEWVKYYYQMAAAQCAEHE